MHTRWLYNYYYSSTVIPTSYRIQKLTFKDEVLLISYLFNINFLWEFARHSLDFIELKME